MSAQISPAQFAVPGHHNIHQISAMWRGALIDHFASLEYITLRCLLALRDAKYLKGSKRSYVAWQRYAVLSEALTADQFAPYNGKAIKLLTALEAEHDLRTALAHGRLKGSAQGMRLAWHAYAKSDWTEQVLWVTWPEALAAMSRIDGLRRDLASQLGQVMRHRCAGKLS